MDDGDNVGPLESLFFDAQPLDEELLHHIIAPYVRFHRAPFGIDFTSAWNNDLSVRQKLLIYLLGRKALHVVAQREQDEEYEEKAVPGTIGDETGVLGNSVRPALKYLRENFLVRSEGGSYYVPNGALTDVEDYLRSE